MTIVANNPNVGVQSRHYDRNGNLTNTGLRWGAQAAGFLMGISRDLESGRLLDANADSYGEVVGYELNSPQETKTEKRCIFNVNISGVSGNTLADMQNEMKRIFASGNLNVVFNNPGQADAGSMNLLVTGQYVGDLAARLGNTVNEVWRLEGEYFSKCRR